MHPDGSMEWRHIAFDWYLVGTEQVVDIVISANRAYASATIFTNIANTFYLSFDGGVTYSVIPDDELNGLSIGSFTPGQRKSAKLKLRIASGAIREDNYQLGFGEGT
jgi:hypothetical protein